MTGKLVLTDPITGFSKTINGGTANSDTDFDLPDNGGALLTKGEMGVNDGAPIFACRAWATWSETVAGTFNGGASTVSRTAGQTTATITTASPHKLKTGNYVYALTGVVAGLYMVTVLNETSFTITTVATTVLSAVAITFQFYNLLGAGNINSVCKAGTGLPVINFTVAMPNTGYAVTGNTTSGNGANGLSIKTVTDYSGALEIYTVNACKLVTGSTTIVDATLATAVVYG